MGLFVGFAAQRTQSLGEPDARGVTPDSLRQRSSVANTFLPEVGGVASVRHSGFHDRGARHTGQASADRCEGGSVLGGSVW